MKLKRGIAALLVVASADVTLAGPLNYFEWSAGTTFELTLPR